jgi:hypothetical protein
LHDVVLVLVLVGAGDPREGMVGPLRSRLTPSVVTAISVLPVVAIGEGQTSDEGAELEPATIR